MDQLMSRFQGMQTSKVKQVLLSSTFGWALNPSLSWYEVSSIDLLVGTRLPMLEVNFAYVPIPPKWEVFSPKIEAIFPLTF